MPNPQTPRSARGGAWGGAGRKWGARGSAPESARQGACEGAREGARPRFSCAKRGGQALSRAPSQAPCRAHSGALSRAPHFRPALPEAPPQALLGVWGFGTSVAGKANRNHSERGGFTTFQFWLVFDPFFFACFLARALVAYTHATCNILANTLPKRTSDPRPPHTRQKYEQTSGQNMTPNASKQGKLDGFGSICSYFCLVCGVWDSKRFPNSKDISVRRNLRDRTQQRFRARKLCSAIPVPCNGRALDRVTKESIDQIGKIVQKMSENCVFSAPSDNFWTFFRTFFDSFRTFCRHFVFLGCPGPGVPKTIGEHTHVVVGTDPLMFCVSFVA